MKEMPKRLIDDGPVAVGRPPFNDDVIYIEVEKPDGSKQRVEMSPFNAWRVFGCLAVMLEIPLPKSTARAIMLGNKPVAVTMGPSRPLTSLGERLAHHLTMKELARVTGGTIVKPKKGRAK